MFFFFIWKTFFKKKYGDTFNNMSFLFKFEVVKWLLAPEQKLEHIIEELDAAEQFVQ